MRISAFALALVLLVGTVSVGWACSYTTASSDEVMAYSGQSQGYPQSKPAESSQPPG